LARPDSTTMALIGAGSQSEFQALGFRAALGIEDLRVFDTDPAAVAKLTRNLEPLGFRITAAESAADAVTGADVITTCIADKAHRVALADENVVPGVHINAVGATARAKP